jgi:hypothetical protein
MERERTLPQPTPTRGGGPGPDATESATLRAEAQELLAAADLVLDTIHPVDAETYLHQNRQRGGE